MILLLPCRAVRSQQNISRSKGVERCSKVSRSQPSSMQRACNGSGRTLCLRMRSSSSNDRTVWHLVSIPSWNPTTPRLGLYMYLHKSNLSSCVKSVFNLGPSPLRRIAATPTPCKSSATSQSSYTLAHRNGDGSSFPPKPFPLSAADANALELLADQLVAETLRTHDDFVAEGRAVDLSRWKMVKQKNNMTAYRSRKRASSRFRRERVPSDETEAVVASPRLPSFYPAIDKKLEHALSETYPSVTFLEDDSDDEPEDEFSYVDVLEQKVLEKARPERAPMVFCTGVVPGTVEDAAFGFLADTETRSRTRNAGNRDVVADDVRILARIHGPTQDDPFRFLGVKWCSHSTPGAAGKFIKPRDYLVIESTGIAFDSDGERFGYVLNHSIVLDEVPDYQQFGNVRVTFSTCHIMRPHETTGAIEIFCRGFMDTGGNLAERLSTYMFCDGLMTVPQTVEESYTRKLLWVYRARRRADSSPPSLESLQISDTCPCCHEKLHSGLAKLLEGNNSMCQLCRHTVCRKCTVKKALPVDVGGPKQLTMKTFDFCLSCYLHAKGLSAWRVAIAAMSTSATESKNCDRI